MKIEVVSIRLVDPNLESGLRGFADIKLDDSVLLKNFRIIQRQGHLFVEGPQATYKKNGKVIFNDIVNFSEELKAKVYTAILAIFFQEKEKWNETPTPSQ